MIKILLFGIALVILLVMIVPGMAFAGHDQRGKAAYVFDCSGYGGGEFGHWRDFRQWVRDNNGSYHPCGYNWINQCFENHGTDTNFRVDACTDSGRYIHHGGGTDLGRGEPKGWGTITLQFVQILQGIPDLAPQYNTKLIFRGYSFGGEAVTNVVSSPDVYLNTLVDLVYLIDPVGPNGNRATLIHNCYADQSLGNLGDCLAKDRIFHPHVKKVIHNYQQKSVPPLDPTTGGFEFLDTGNVENRLYDCGTDTSKNCHTRIGEDPGKVLYNILINTVDDMNNTPVVRVGDDSSTFQFVFEEGDDSSSVHIGATDQQGGRYEELHNMDLRFTVPDPKYTSLIENGGFEAGAYPGRFDTLHAGNENLLNQQRKGWDIESGSVDLVQYSWISYEGDKSIDMSGARGTSPNTIYQSFPTQDGKEYKVSFEMSGNNSCGLIYKELKVRAGNTEKDFSFESSGSNKGMGWKNESFTFNATSDTTKLEFRSDDDSGCGAALDNVSVIDIAENPFHLDIDQGTKSGQGIYLVRTGSLTVSPLDNVNTNIVLQVYDNGFPCDNCLKNPDARGATGKWGITKIPVVIKNLPPTAKIDVDDQDNFHFSANDPSPIDQAAGFAYNVDWGDGDQNTYGNPVLINQTFTTTHDYSSPGPFTVTLTATDKDEGVSEPVSLSYTPTIASVEPTLPDDKTTTDEPTLLDDEIKTPELSIPDWIKNTAGWWSEKSVDDSDFTGGISYLIEEDIISIPDLPVVTEAAEENVPDWVRNMAGWWADNLTTDQEFADAIKFLVEKGIIQVQT